MVRKLWIWICLWSIIWTLAVVNSWPNDECSDVSNLSDKVKDQIIIFSSEVDKIRRMNSGKKIKEVCLSRDSYLDPYNLVYKFTDWTNISTSDVN